MDEARIEVDLSTDPLSGIVHSDGEQPRPFRGWIELVALIERARADATITDTQEVP